MNFPFLMDSLKAPTPLMAPTPLKICYSWQNFFVDAPQIDI